MSLRTRIVASITAIKSAALGTSPGTRSTNIQQTTVVQLASGTGDGQASKEYRKEFTLASNASLELDLSGPVTGDSGEAVTFTAIKAFMLQVGSSSNGDGRLFFEDTFNPLATDASPAITGLAAGDVALAYRINGVTIGAGNKLLTITAAGPGTVTATLTLIGT